MKSTKSLDIIDKVNKLRIAANKNNTNFKKRKFSQYFTEKKLSEFIASISNTYCSHIKILDPGAGVGSLTAALVNKLCSGKSMPTRISVVLFEIDPQLINYLKVTVDLCQKKCIELGIVFESQIYNEDFIEYYSSQKVPDIGTFNLIIMNPPYKKISVNSKEHKMLSKIDLESKNLYTAFLLIASQLMEQNGELIAIIPRSFCNGTSFKSFRSTFFEINTLKRVHIFNSRSQLFQEDNVLQENIILQVTKSKNDYVTLTSSNDLNDPIKSNIVSYDYIIHPNDSEIYIRLPYNQKALDNLEKMKALNLTLIDIGLSVSTGKVVDFRTTEHLRTDYDDINVPLIYPSDLRNGQVEWCISKKKPNLIEVNPKTEKLLLHSNFYVVVKRFTSKEEKKRIVAAFFDYRKIPYKYVGFENHLNYFHKTGGGIEINFGKGLVLFLNSSHVDNYFRQFSGLTQVNANDLFNLPYPSKQQLTKLGSYMKTKLPKQTLIDYYVDKVCFN